MGQSAVAGEQDTLVGPGRGDDFQNPAVRSGGVKSSPKSPAMRTLLPATGPSPGHVRSAAASGVLSSRVGVAVPGDLLPRDGAEEAMTVVRDDPHQVVAAVGMRREADSEEPDGDEGGADGLPDSQRRRPYGHRISTYPRRTPARLLAQRGPCPTLGP